MPMYRTHQEIVKRLGELSEKLTSGKLSEEELLDFENLSRNLYERAIVLNYKAKESSVYSKNSSETEKKVETKEPETEKIEPEKKERVGEIAFDFSSEEEANSNTIDKKESEPKEEISVDKEGVSEDSSLKHEVKTAKEVEKAEKSSSDQTNSFYEKFNMIGDNSLMDKLGSSKLESLKGAIGLNDKLQFISELFAGNSELFNKAIDILDNQENRKEALGKLNKIAADQGWDPESTVVEEFIKTLNRRYVD